MREIMKQTRRIIPVRYAMVLVALSVLIFVSCDVVENSIGPPLPKRDTTVYLEACGASKDLIYRVVDLKQLEIEKIQELSISTNVSVRYLIAKNPFTPEQIYKRLMADESEFVRQGAARSRSINAEQAFTLSKDPSTRVQGALVANPSVAEALILELRKKNRNIPLTDFAMNIRCPAKIRQEILESRDTSAKQWLSQKWADDHYNSPPARLPDPTTK
jgi:hypothetical protein